MFFVILSLSSVGAVQAQSVLDIAKKASALFKSKKVQKDVEEAKKDMPHLDISNVLNELSDSATVTDAQREANDVRRQQQVEMRKRFEENGLDFSLSELSKETFDSVGIYSVKDGKKEALDHVTSHEGTTKFSLSRANNILYIPNSTSKCTFDGKACFRIYFTHDINSISEKYYMFSNNLTMDDFFVIDLKANKSKDRREYFSGSTQTGDFYSKGKAKAGSASKKVKMTVNKVRESVYDVIVEGEPGEYAITWVEHNRLDGPLFDFTIK